MEQAMSIVDPRMRIFHNC